MGQCEAACQVKNAHELFRNTLHMINVARGKSIAAGDKKKKKEEEESLVMQVSLRIEMDNGVGGGLSYRCFDLWETCIRKLSEIPSIMIHFFVDSEGKAIYVCIKII